MTTTTTEEQEPAPTPAELSERERVADAALLDLDECHRLLDALCAGYRDETVADRIRCLVADAVGDRAQLVLNFEHGKALGRAWQKVSSQLGHQAECPCHPCRESRDLAR